MIIISFQVEDNLPGLYIEKGGKLMHFAISILAKSNSITSSMLVLERPFSTRSEVVGSAVDSFKTKIVVLTFGQTKS